MLKSKYQHFYFLLWKIYEPYFLYILLFKYKLTYRNKGKGAAKLFPPDLHLVLSPNSVISLLSCVVFAFWCKQHPKSFYCMNKWANKKSQTMSVPWVMVRRKERNWMEKKRFNLEIFLWFCCRQTQKSCKVISKKSLILTLRSN